MTPETAADNMENGEIPEPGPAGEVDSIPLDGDIDDTNPGGEGGSSGLVGSLIDAMLNTEPETDLNQIESPYNPEDGGMSRVYRGVQKMSGMDGLPAIADIVIGVIEIQQDRENSIDVTNEDRENEIERI